MCQSSEALICIMKLRRSTRPTFARSCISAWALQHRWLLKDTKMYSLRKQLC